MKNLKALENRDYQNRDGHYPESGKPDIIEVVEGDRATNVFFEFKNTSEQAASNWVSKYLTFNGFTPDGLAAYQDGDYQDDWVTVTARFAK